jgi:sulfatase modifying factor 1
MADADPRQTPDAASFPDMVWIPGGTFRMGSDKHYLEERPTHRVTFAEIPPTLEQYPEALPHMLYAGSLVFMQPSGPVDRNDFTNW